MRTAVIADDHSLFLYGLALLLREEFGISNVIEAASLDDACANLAKNPQAELAFIDLYMPGMAGARSLAHLKFAYPATKIVMLTASENAADAEQAIDAGADGYIPKSLSEDRLVAAIRTIMRGQIYKPTLLHLKSPPTAAQHAQAAVRAKKKQVLVNLTSRQREIFDCVCLGFTNRQIANELDLSPSTVANHISHLLDLFDVGDRNELAIIV